MKSIVSTSETYNIIDFLSSFFMMFILPFSCAIPFLMSTGIPSISSLALSGDLCWPKYGFLGPLGAFLLMSADLLGQYILAISIVKRKYTPKLF